MGLTCYRCRERFDTETMRCACADGQTIICGDCVDIMPQLKRIGIVVTDPPYFLPAVHHATRSGTSKSWGNLSILGHYFSTVFEKCHQVLSNAGVLYCFCDSQSYPVFYRAAYNRFRSVRCIVWDKLNSINGYWWRHQHELILFATKQETPHEPTGDGDVIQMRCVPIGERVHDAEKPVAILERLIAKGSHKIVLDPYCGSGSTLLAARKLGIQGIGIEIEESNCKLAAERLRQGVLAFTD